MIWDMHFTLEPLPSYTKPGMPRLRYRRLGYGVSRSTENPPPPSPPPPPGVDYDLVLIIASLLCVLIGLLGLVAYARCCWIRRRDADMAARSAANRGLKKKVLESLPKFTFGDEEQQTEKLSDCAICLTDFTAGDEIRVLPTCGHGFHVGCIDTWLGSHSSCPSCRQTPVAVACRKCGRTAAAVQVNSSWRQ